MGVFTNSGRDGVDANLVSWLQQAAAESPYNVTLSSGARPGDPRFHGRGMAADVRLIDPKTGSEVPNYQDAKSFSTYQDFANRVRAAQMAKNPELASRLRWGGYFSGGKGKYGALDLMHFDTGGETTPMGGGSWDTGLHPQQAAIWGLNPGGGYAGGGGGGGSGVASTLAAAVGPRSSGYDPRVAALMQLEAEPTPSFTGAASRRGGLNLGERSAGTPSVDSDPGVPPPIETASATVTPGSLKTPASPKAPSNLIPDLASIFQVGPIGQAAKQVVAQTFPSSQAAPLRSA